MIFCQIYNETFPGLNIFESKAQPPKYKSIPAGSLKYILANPNNILPHFHTELSFKSLFGNQKILWLKVLLTYRLPEGINICFCYK